MTPMVSKPIVAVAMSGGVDSAVTAACLVRDGWPVIGMTLKLWPEAATAGRRSSCTAIDDARAVAARLGIPHRVLDRQETFERAVAHDFAAAYAGGETPNPCVACNSQLKFGALLEYAQAAGAQRLATGHYARIRRRPGRYELLRAIDPQRDQSYFLYSLTQPQLAAALFPLGDQHKRDVRRMAREWGLPVADKPDSQQVCFAAGDYRQYLRSRLGDGIRPGPMVDTGGRLRGEHGGLPYYTVGQRHGLGLDNPQPLYVIALDATENAVVIGEERELWRREAKVAGVTWTSVAAPDAPLPVLAQIRRAHEPAAATLVREGPGQVRLSFAAPQRAVAAGQAAVFYDAADPDRVLGGGRIVRERAAIFQGERRDG
jgi:tRNA-uridine 2-sulfurtransferase